MNHAMMFNLRKVTIRIGAEDALLLLGHLRSERFRFQEAGNEVMTGMLERVDEALTAAQAPKQMPRFDHRKCEDEDDATRMAETMLRDLGFDNVQKGSCSYSVNEELGIATLRKIAQTAERIARWARTELKRRGV